MNFYEVCTNFIFNDKKILTLFLSPIEFTNIVFMLFFISSLFQIKKDIKSEFKNIIIFGLIFCINRIFFSRIISGMLYIIEISIILKILKKENIFKIISTICISFLGIDIIHLLFSNLFYNSNGLFEIIKEILSVVVLANIYVICKNFDISINKIKNINKNEILKNIFIITTIVIVLYLQALAFRKINFLESAEFAFLNIITITLFFYVMMSNFAKTRKIRQASVYIDCLEVYNKNLTEMNDNIRGFKHDFNNIVQAINGYIMLEDIKSLKKYFKRLMVECEQIKMTENLSPKIIKDPAIYSLLLRKYSLAQENEIKVNLEIIFDFSKISEHSYDISRILGILLDNAIEASIECEEKEINIQFLTKNNIRYINIENTFNKEKNVDTCKIFEKNFTTKKEHGNTGIGLWEVKKILERNKNLELYTIKKEDFFIQSLEIYENPIG